MSGLLIGILLVVCVGLFAGYRIKYIECEDLKQCRANDFMQFKIAKEQLFASQKEAGELRAELSERSIPAQAEDEPAKGSFVQTRALKRANPGTYRNVFDLDINGKRVIDHLERTFASANSYVRGGHDAERESCFKAGQASVIGFIFKQINTANSPNYNPKNYEEQVND